MDILHMGFGSGIVRSLR